MKKNVEGLSQGEIIQTCWSAYQHAREGAGLPELSWDDLGEEEREGFLGAVGYAWSIFEEGELAPIKTWHELALACLSRMVNARPHDDVESLTGRRLGRETICAEALVRHLCNALMYDKEEDGELQGHEHNWLEWSRIRARHQEAEIN